MRRAADASITLMRRGPVYAWHFRKKEAIGAPCDARLSLVGRILCGYFITRAKRAVVISTAAPSKLIGAVASSPARRR